MSKKLSKNCKQLAAVKCNGFAIEHIKNPSEEVKLAAVKRNGLAIKFIENPSEEIQLAAVNTNENSVKFIENPSEEVQLAAIRKSPVGTAILYIENPSEAVQLAAMAKTGRCIQFVKNPSEKVQFAALEEWGFAIAYIHDPSEEMQLAAIKQDYRAILLRKNSTPSTSITLPQRLPSNQENKTSQSKFNSPRRERSSIFLGFFLFTRLQTACRTMKPAFGQKSPTTVHSCGDVPIQSCKDFATALRATTVWLG
jgi:hypothetical protein